MNNYSWLQQKLHQFALSSSLIRTSTFDVESYLFSSYREFENHVFISGLARSGSTILLNALYQSDEFASLSYINMPFVLAPNLWSKLSSNKKNHDLFERAHGDGLEVSLDSPEAFEEVFWMTFKDNEEETIKKFKSYVQNVNQSSNKNRYLSKNNQNIKRLDLISTIYPSSKILIPFREPINHAYSLLRQHKRFLTNSKEDKFISDYMKWIGHLEFGPHYKPLYEHKIKFTNSMDINHWLEQWCMTYQDCYKNLIDNKNVYFICYEELCSSKKYWEYILNSLDVYKPYDFEFKLSKRNIFPNIDQSLSDRAKSIYFKLYRYVKKNI